jgi:PAS domain S-box-containing protein
MRQNGSKPAEFAYPARKENATVGRDFLAASFDFVAVPIFVHQKKWGELELRFRPGPESADLTAGIIPLLLPAAFMGLGSFMVFAAYLRLSVAEPRPSLTPQEAMSTLDALTEGIVILDRSGRIVVANEPFGIIAGERSQKLVGKRFDAFCWASKNGDPVADPPWQRAADERCRQGAVIVQLRSQTGRHRTLAVRAIPIIGTDGKCRGVMIAFQDQTWLEQVLARVNLALQEAELLRDQAVDDIDGDPGQRASVRVADVPAGKNLSPMHAADALSRLENLLKEVEQELGETARNHELRGKIASV